MQEKTKIRFNREMILFTVGISLIICAYIFGTPISTEQYTAAMYSGAWMLGYSVYFGCLILGGTFLISSAVTIVCKQAQKHIHSWR